MRKYYETELTAQEFAYFSEIKTPYNWCDIDNLDILEQSMWKGATDAEMEVLKKNSTWNDDLVKLPDGSKAIGSRWVFKKKVKEDGSIRYKARLVAQGFAQREGIDYNETYAPVAKFTSIRTILSLVAIEDLECDSTDVTAAFLNGVLKETVYMKQPKGYKVAGEEFKVLKLNKSIYGLKQSPKAWNDEVNSHLEDTLGYKRLVSDSCLYYKRDDKDLKIIVVYVDDKMVVGKEVNDVAQMKVTLKNKWEMTDGGPIQNFLGLRITRN